MLRRIRLAVILFTAGCASQLQLGSGGSAIQGAAGGKAAMASGVPKCAAPLGAAALVEPDPKVVTLLGHVGLQSPTPLIRLLMMQSNCFAVVDRGAALGAMQQQERLRADGMLADSTQGARSHMIAARWLITPNVVFSEPHAGGSSIGGLIGGFVAGPLGGVVGSAMSVSVQQAQVVLFVTDAQTGLQTAAAEGSAKVRDFGGAGGLGGIGAGLIGFGGISGYSNTNEGKLIAAALLDAYGKLVGRLQPLAQKVGAMGDGHQLTDSVSNVDRADLTARPARPSAHEASVARAGTGRTYAPRTTVNVRAAPAAASPIVTQVPPSSVLSAIGEEKNGWVLVDTGHRRGWVLAKNLIPRS